MAGQRALLSGRNSFCSALTGETAVLVKSERSTTVLWVGLERSDREGSDAQMAFQLCPP